MSRDTTAIERGAATIGVILSLLFVGYEIRQNTQVARATAVSETTGHIIEWGTQVGTDPEWIRVITFLYGGGSYAELSEQDKTRYGWIVGHTVRIMENRYRQMQMGVITEADLGVAGGTSNPSWFRSEHFLEWWQSADRSVSWAPDFLLFFETEVLQIKD